jgi:hypothetical protein
MKRFTRVFIRPHTEVDFYKPSDTFLQHIQDTYIATGKCTKFREATFKDQGKLVLELVSEWDDEISESIADNDPVWAANYAIELEYNTACEIILAHKELETIS